MSTRRPPLPTLLWRSRLRLAGLSLLLMGAILYSAGLLMARLLLHEQQTAIRRELQSLAGTLHDSLKPALPPTADAMVALGQVLPGLCLGAEPCGSPTALTERHAVSATDPTRFQLRILGPEGAVIANSPGAAAIGTGITDTGWQERLGPSGDRRLTYTINLHRSHGGSQQNWGYLQISRSLAELDHEARQLIWLGHGVFSLAMVGMALASWWLAGLAMGPLLEAYRRQEQFSADVAHELRTPLANLLAVVEAERGAIAETTHPKTATSLDRILGQGRRLQQLISDLLLLASLERPCSQNQKQVCDMAEITADVAEDFSEAAAAAQVNLLQNQWLHSAKVLGVESELSRLVINLLSNALLHTPAGGQIYVGLEQRSNTLTLSIRDSGPGIAAKEQARIFDRFTRLDPSRSQQLGGTGLGLAIAQAIARRHGTAITVRSNPGCGAVFSLQLAALL